MNTNLKLSFLVLTFLTGPIIAFAQILPERLFTLKEVIDLARLQSPDALQARHSFQAAYWSYRSFKANYLPSVSLSSNPYLNRSENRITMSDGKSKFVMQQQIYSDISLKVNQNIALTGGSIFVKSSLQRQDELSDGSASYNSTPIVFGFSQSIFGYNGLKWEQKREPLYYEKAKRSYVEAMELVSSRACSYFFNLAQSQSDLKTARQNYANADTLYRFAQGRYNIGTITENELLQLEINKLKSETDAISAEANVNYYQQQLISFLGINERMIIHLDINDSIPIFKVDPDTVLALTLKNSPDILSMELKKINAESSVANAKAASGLKMDIYAQFGLSRTTEELKDAYRNPNNQQYVSIGISVPLLDWGRGEGQVKVAKSNLELTQLSINQDRSNIEQNVSRMVWNFNLQSNMIKIAEKTAQTALRHYEVTYKLYLLGKTTVLDLNSSISSKDAAQRNYINTISSFWGMYYTLRSMTLYDFESGDELTSEWKVLLDKH